MVADIFGRRQHPSIQLEFSIEASIYIDKASFPTISFPILGQAPREEPKRKPKFELAIRARNTGRVFAQYVNSFVYVPVELIPEYEREFNYSENDIEEVDGIKHVVWSKRNIQRDIVKTAAFGVHQYGSSWFDPILPGLSYTWKWKLTESFDKNKFGNMKIIWEVYADNAPKKTGSILIREIDIITKAEKP
ncbi:hypothetical protein [Chloroflexus islandicus]|uniref:hypothetical protein n=1 Tax=Chloroflexus islandicus TaxID=1707952 RepID=UPI0012E898FC